MFSRFGAKEISYNITTADYKLPIPITYCLRALKGSFILAAPRFDGYAIFCASDWWPDCIPLLIRKMLRRNAKCITAVYHFIPPPSKRPGGFTISNLLSYTMQRLTLPLLTKWSDLLYTETEFVKESLVKKFQLPTEKIIKCESGIEPQFIDSIKPSKDKVYDGCYVARLHKSKGVLDLITAWKTVCEDKPHAQLAIVGMGSTAMIEKVNKQIHEFSLQNNIKYLGFQSEENKYRLLKASRIYILPSYEEGIPITFAEAMYCGLPIVTYFLPTYEPYRNLLITVKLGDKRLLAETIKSVLCNEVPLQQLSQRGKSWAEKHTWGRIASFTIAKLEALG